MTPISPSELGSDLREPGKLDFRLLIFVGCSLFFANIGQWALGHALGYGNPGGLKVEAHDFLHVTQWTDSWLPMMKSLDYYAAHPTLPIYYAKLYDTLIYSLASLLPLMLLRKLGLSDPALLRVLAVLSWLAVVGVAVVCVRLAQRLLRAQGLRLRWPDALAVALGCLGCYPLLKGYALGNAQTFLSLGFAVVLLLWATGRERSAGVVAAMLAFVKPQYVLLLIWMAVRRRWGAAVAFLTCAALLVLLSVAVFGWRNNLDYIPVLASLSHKAQTHFGNQSMFGTLNRMIFNGENLGYTPNVYTPYIPWVYRVTVATSLLLVLTTLLFPWGRLRGSVGDLGSMGVISVAASPMAWEHHYGIVLGLFVWAWFAYGKREGRSPADVWMLSGAFFLTTNFLAMANLLADRRGWNVLQSYMYFGALLLVASQMVLARRATRGAVAPQT